MVANKGRYKFRQYIKDKPTKWGMKVWVLADSGTGNTWNYEVYKGSEGKPVSGLGYQVVMNLCSHLFNQGYNFVGHDLLLVFSSSIMHCTEIQSFSNVLSFLFVVEVVQCSLLA